MTGNLSDTIRTLEERLANHSDDVAALHDLSVLYQRTGQWEHAFAMAQRVSMLAPDFAEGWLNIGNIEARQGQKDVALKSYRRATDLAPDNALAWYNMGNILAQIGYRSESIDALERARGLAPENVNVLASLALAYRKQNRVQDAIATYEHALKTDPTNHKIHSNLLVAHQYGPSSTDESLYRTHMRWNELKSSPSPPWPAVKEKRPLRIGYVSGDFRQHPIGFFLSGVLKNHDPGVVTAVCFSDTTSEDTVTQNMRDCAHQWVDTRGMSDDAFKATVQQNEIDILIDLSGHFNHSRLTVFAERAAPVQATWAGYVGTTGVASMDWLIADKHHAPAGFENWTIEKIIRLPNTYVCYSPPENAPPVLVLASDSSGVITFGCFNNLVKINDDVIRVWARILNAVSGSRLLLKCRDLDQPDLRQWIHDRLSEENIEDSRVDLRSGSPHHELLETYNDADIALDPFPYSGGLTTLEALWMGVPVLTKTGQTFAGRHSPAYLSEIGLTDWIAENEEEYVALAKTKAEGRDALRSSRALLREKVSSSPICDSEAFTRTLELAFQNMWAFVCSDDGVTVAPRVIDIHSAV